MNREHSERHLTDWAFGGAITGIVIVALAATAYVIWKADERRKPPSRSPLDGLRVLSVALEAYAVDWSSYPLPLIRIEVAPASGVVAGVEDRPSTDDGFTTGAVGFPDPVTGSLPAGCQVYPCALTSPIAYLTSAPFDPYGSGLYPFYDYRGYWYVEPTRQFHFLYVLVGSGPDGDRDFPLDEFMPIPDSVTHPAWSLDREYGLPRPLLTYQFDPTNGAQSDGDMIIFRRPGGTLW